MPTHPWWGRILCWWWFLWRIQDVIQPCPRIHLSKPSQIIRRSGRARTVHCHEQSEIKTDCHTRGKKGHVSTSFKISLQKPPCSERIFVAIHSLIQSKYKTHVILSLNLITFCEKGDSSNTIVITTLSWWSDEKRTSQKKWKECQYRYKIYSKGHM